jgi:selenocysteine lyase/cysteine desulfurase
VLQLDVDRARALTPGCEHVLHLNHAGASLLPQPVLDAVVGHIQREALIGGYEAGDDAVPALDRTRQAVARLIGAQPDEIALVESATTGWGAALHAFGLGAGDRILIGRAEYGSNAMTLLQLARSSGCVVELVEDDGHGQIDLDALERALASGPTALVSLVHVPTSNGLVNPAREAGALCRAAGVPLVLDACQSVGQLPIDVDDIGCDILTASGRKFLRGPRGAAFLYVRRSLLPRLEPRTLDLHGASWVGPERFELAPTTLRFEQFDASIAGRIGLGIAAEHALEWGLEAIADRNRHLADGLRARLAEVRGVTVRDRGAQLCAITTFTVDGVTPTEAAGHLRAQGTNVRSASVTFAQLDLGARGLDAVVRASVHYVNTDDELDRFTEQVRALALSAPV